MDRNEEHRTLLQLQFSSKMHFLQKYRSQMEFTLEAMTYVVKLALIVTCLYLSFHLYLSRRRTEWVDHFAKRRLSILSVFILLVMALMVAQKVLNQHSAPMDRSIILYVHSHVPQQFNDFFELVTLSGSSNGLGLFTLILLPLLLYFRCRAEALLVGLTMILAPLTIYVLKTLVERQRPALWETAWYWGSSFPSGHTLGTTAFAVSCALCVLRLKPTMHKPALSAALVWICLVGLSRLVLGVHWPTDVLAAMCIGAFIPLMLNMAIEIQQRRKLQ